MKPNKTEDLMYYWVRLKNNKISGKITDIKKLEDKPKESDYCLLRGKTIKVWNKMDIKTRELSLNMDTLVLSAAKGQPQSETDKLINNITNLMRG